MQPEKISLTGPPDVVTNWKIQAYIAAQNSVGVGEFVP
jgi:hypothetical protein